jgi:hypothetical protein
MEPADRRPDDKDQGELITDIFGLQWSRPVDGRMMQGTLNQPVRPGVLQWSRPVAGRMSGA